MNRTRQTDDEQLLREALEALDRTVGLGIEKIEVQAKGRLQVDGYLHLAAPFGRYAYEVKGNVTAARVGAVAAQLKALAGRDPVVLIAHHVTPPVAAQLRDCGVQFLDTAGNAYLRKEKPFAHVWVTGNKPEKKRHEKPVIAFREKGLRVIFPLLCLPGAVDGTYRQIAAWAGVGLGTVAYVMEDLERLGLVRRTREGRVLEDRAELQRRWVEAYPEILRPQLKAQRFHVIYTDWWREFDRKRYEKHQLWLGGEAAAALLTRYLQPELVTVYGRPDFQKLARELKPARAAEGNLELREPFWNFEVPVFDPECEMHRFCPPLLIYADLVATGEARQLDAAAIIKEKYLGQGSNHR